VARTTKLKTPRRRSVTKPVRRYDTSGRTIGSGATTRRTTRTPKPPKVVSKSKGKVGRPSQGKTEVVTSKSGKTYRRAVKPKVRVTPNTVYVAGGAGPRKVPVDPSEVVVKRGKTAIPANYRGSGFRGGFPPSDTTGGAVKQSTQSEIKNMQKQMNAERNMNRAQAVSDAFDERFRALKRKLAGIQGNPGIRAFHGGGGGSKR
jgi:hypothetical protein